MSAIRYYLPQTVNDTIMYYVGKARSIFQYYIDNTFSASAITERLFIGDLASASNAEAMKEQGITHIVAVYNGAIEIFKDEFKYMIIHINDDTWDNIMKHFDETNRFIDDALQNQDSKVMIHCQRGASRSVTIFLAYTLYKMNFAKQIPFDQIDDVITSVLEEVRTHRPIADPNEGFIRALREYICVMNGYDTQNEVKNVCDENLDQYQEEETDNSKNV